MRISDWSSDVCSSDLRDFGAFLGLVEQCRYGWAYRILDAQFAGVPQRRRRLFLVGHLGDWRPAAEVLFEPESLSGHPPPRREAGEGTTGAASTDFGGGRRSGPVDVSAALTAHGRRQDFETETFRSEEHTS